MRDKAESAPLDCKADFIASIYGQLVMREMPDKLPPLFAAMSSDDELSGQSGFEIIKAWQKRGVVELHLYGQGGHNCEKATGWDMRRTQIIFGLRSS